MKPIRLEDGPRFHAASAQAPTFSCEQSWANLFLWSAVYDTQWEEREERILLHSVKEGCWHFPLGKWADSARLCEWCGAGEIYDVPPDYPFDAALWERSATPDAYDYLYENAKLFASGGGRLRKKRNLARQFVAANPAWRLEAITPENLATAAQLAKRLNAALRQAEFLDEENLVLERTWEHFFDPRLRLEGVILYAADDVPAGFSVISPISDGVADVHFEKADHEIKGAPQQLTREYAGRLADRYRWMNREQDMGEEGLRHAKESLDPAFLFERCNLKPRNNN